MSCWGLDIYYNKYREIRDFVMSIIVLGISLSWRYVVTRFYSYALTVFIAIGIGFLFHELAHRFTARLFGAYSRYRAWYLGLAIALILSIATQGTIVFAAPGAVEVYTPWFNPRAELYISSAGPLSNIFISLICTLIYVLTSGSAIQPYIRVVAYVNSILAFFNLFPVPPLDGYKILRRNVIVWLLLFIISILLIVHYR